MELLKLLHYPKELPTLFGIQKLAFRADLYNMLKVLLVISSRYWESCCDGDFIELAENAEENTDMYSCPGCIKKIKYILDLFDRRGNFEF